MVANPAVVPYVPTYASRFPYITPAEYKASPTGVNVDQLVAGGTTQVNADALVQTIARASSWVDQICNQVLAATVEVQVGQFLINDGYMTIAFDYSPLVQVNSVSAGKPNELTTAGTLAGVILGRKTAKVPVSVLAAAATGRVYAVCEYVAGYANTMVAVQATIGATTITLADTTGIVPGLRMTIYDPGQSEDIVVLSVAGNVITLTAPTTATHSVGVGVSALPDAVKQATVLLTSALIKTRGSQAVVVQSMQGTTQQKERRVLAGVEEQQLAESMLIPNFMRVA